MHPIITGLVILLAKDPDKEVGLLILFSIVGPLLLVAVIIITIVLVVRAREKARTSQLETIVGGLGLEFLPKGDGELVSRLAGFPLMNRGHSHELKNLLRGDTPQAKIAIFDYRFVTGHGKNKTTHRQTVMAMETEELQLTAFSLRPEGMWDKVGGVLGFQDIDFLDHEEFSKKFVLKGESEEDVRSYLDHSLLDFFVERPDICCEARPEGFLYYRRRKRLATEAQAIQDFMEEGMNIFVSLLERATRG